MRLLGVLFAILAPAANAETLDISDAFAAEMRAVLPCDDAGFISSPTSALAFCGAPVPSVEFILIPPGATADDTTARVQASCGRPAQACTLTPIENGWLAQETQDGHVHTTALVQVGAQLLEIRSMAAEPEAAMQVAQAVLPLLLGQIDGSMGAAE